MSWQLPFSNGAQLIWNTGNFGDTLSTEKRPGIELTCNLSYCSMLKPLFRSNQLLVSTNNLHVLKPFEFLGTWTVAQFQRLCPEISRPVQATSFIQMDFRLAVCWGWGGALMLQAALHASMQLCSVSIRSLHQETSTEALWPSALLLAKRYL